MKTIPPFAYIPYGAGQCMCIGNEFARVEALVVIHCLLTEYEWRQLIPDEPISHDSMSKGLPINIIVRNSM
ncbi:hypothetical protein QJS10_CPB21g01610 [Acorus calamus]|uniref:Cytochrome P450 n=1 Tax=Acorus calamus TaxID=4465 RepID=A0AAV9C4D2_ACOCL|nr:hypothetical protein QJS10_CPB21g01610 [Acorus calamus]